MHSDNGASVVDILAHIGTFREILGHIGTFWDISEKFGRLYDEFGAFRLFSQSFQSIFTHNRLMEKNLKSTGVQRRNGVVRWLGVERWSDQNCQSLFLGWFRGGWLGWAKRNPSHTIC